MQRKSSHYKAPTSIRTASNTILQMYLLYTTAVEGKAKQQSLFNPLTALPVGQMTRATVQTFLINRLAGSPLTTTKLMADFYNYSMAEPILFIALVLADHHSNKTLTSVAAQSVPEQRESGPDAIRRAARKSLPLMPKGDKKLQQELEHALANDSSITALFDPLFMTHQKFAATYSKIIENGRQIFEQNRPTGVIAVPQTGKSRKIQQPPPPGLVVCLTGSGGTDRAVTINAFYATLRDQARAGNDTLYTRIVARIDWIRRQRLSSAAVTSPVLRSLPYMVPYEQAYVTLFQWLCVLQNQSRHFLDALVENDDTLDEAYSRLPCFPYQRLAQMGRSDDSRTLYLYVYCYDVLRPRVFRAFWSHALTLISGVPPPSATTAVTTRTQISCADAEYLYNTLHVYNALRVAQPECLYTPQFEQTLRQLFTARFVVHEGIVSTPVRRIPQAVDDSAISSHALDNYLLQAGEYGVDEQTVVVDYALLATDPVRVREILDTFLRRPTQTPQYATSATTLCEMTVNDDDDDDQQQTLYHPIDTAMRACVTYCRDESSRGGVRSNGTVFSLFETSHTVSVGDFLHAYADLASVSGTNDGGIKQSDSMRQSRLQDLLNLLSFDGRSANKEARRSQLDRMQTSVETPHASYHTTRQIHAFSPDELLQSMGKHGVQTLGQARRFIRERYRPLRRVPVDSYGLQQCSRVETCLIVVRTTTLDGGTELYVDVSGDTGSLTVAATTGGGLYDDLLLSDPESQITICVTLNTYKYRLLEWRDQTRLWSDDDDDAAGDDGEKPTLQLLLEDRVVEPLGRVLRVDSQRATTMYWRPSVQHVGASRMMDRETLLSVLGVQKDERTRVSAAYDSGTSQLRLCVIQDREADPGDDEDAEGVEADEELAFFFISTLLYDYRLYRETLRLAGKTRYDQGQTIRSVFAIYRSRDFRNLSAHIVAPLRIFYADDNGEYGGPNAPIYTLDGVSTSLIGNELRLVSTRPGGGSITLSAEQLIRNTERYISRDPRTRIPVVWQYMTDAVASARGELI